MLFKLFFSKSTKSYAMLEEKDPQMLFQQQGSQQIAQFYANNLEDAENRKQETIERHKRQNKHLF